MIRNTRSSASQLDCSGHAVEVERAADLYRELGPGKTSGTGGEAPARTTAWLVERRLARVKTE